VAIKRRGVLLKRITGSKGEQQRLSNILKLMLEGALLAPAQASRSHSPKTLIKKQRAKPEKGKINEEFEPEGA